MQTNASRTGEVHNQSLRLDPDQRPSRMHFGVQNFECLNITKLSQPRGPVASTAHLESLCKEPINALAIERFLVKCRNIANSFAHTQAK
jgi:hypothetical protein